MDDESSWPQKRKKKDGGDAIDPKKNFIANTLAGENWMDFSWTCIFPQGNSFFLWLFAALADPVSWISFSFNIFITGAVMYHQTGQLKFYNCTASGFYGSLQYYKKCTPLSPDWSHKHGVKGPDGGGAVIGGRWCHSSKKSYSSLLKSFFIGRCFLLRVTLNGTKVF